MPKANAQNRGPTSFRDLVEGTEGKILAATFDCIVENGAAKTTTRAITDKAGLPRGILHYHFRSKEELLLRLLSVLFDNFTRNTSRTAALDIPPLAKLDLILDAGLTLLSSRRDEFVVMVNLWTHAMAEGGEPRNVYQELFNRFRSAVAQAVEEGEQRGVFRPGSASTIPLILVGLVEGAGIQYVMDETAGDLGAIAQAMKALIHTIRT